MRINLLTLNVCLGMRFLCSLLLLWSSSALATIDTQTLVVENASNWTKPTVQATNPSTGAGTTTGNVEIYGGIMGDISVCAGGTSTCNNCTASNTPCNSRRITPDTELVIKFKTDNAAAITLASQIFILVDTNTQVVPARTTLPANMAVNAELMLAIRWGDLCANIGSGSDCSTPVSKKSIQIGISSDANTTLEESLTIQISVLGSATGLDANGASYQYVTPCRGGVVSGGANLGFCWVQLERGDEKVYISDEYYYNGGSYSALRVYYAEGPETGDNTTFPTVVNSGPTIPYKDFTFTLKEDIPTLNENKITGLDNGKRYYFMFANVDMANNVFYFSNYTSGPSPTGNEYLEYQYHSAVPQEVSGALEGKECFIATAAYGSPMAPQLDILRSFRDQFLKTHAIGRWLVKKYYIYGPKWAQKIKKRDSVRVVVRTALNPVVSVAQWMILYGLKSFILISLMGFIIGFFIIRRVTRDHE